ncbi:FlhC family transcriptional regulator [Pseudomonas sp. DP-17]|uniref:FlhC family transcriptional regulator n=1 Tax=Pseudomonas sp. DP-17 TaxID=1580486 RepID=UPI001EFBED6C|nr:FlhC family transcriptional regulator [Pseudomonas sp. DP-17]MCG8910948.1 FlhC family transcriptional regulator [Pseudomonas sp. DP-17]
MKFTINRTLVQMAVRWLIQDEAAFKLVLMQQRYRQDDIVWLTNVVASPPKLQALDALPVSINRIEYETLSVGNTHLDDKQFFNLGLRLTMFTELFNFARHNSFNTLNAIGLDDTAFRLMETSSFEERLMLIRSGGFTISIRSPVRKLRLNPNSTRDQIHDTTLVLLGDLRFFLKKNPDGSGRMQDFGPTIPTESIARELLLARIQPKLVALATGMSPEEAGKLKRNITRGVPGAQSQSGRIQIPETTLAEYPMHSLLYLTIYRLLAHDPLRRTNVRALMAAHREYEQICDALNVPKGDTITPTNAFQLSNAIKSGEILMQECSSCSEINARFVLKPAKCIWCGH